MPLILGYNLACDQCGLNKIFLPVWDDSAEELQSACADAGWSVNRHRNVWCADCIEKERRRRP